MEEMTIDQRKLYDSKDRLPICLVLDTSTSMSGQPIDELNKALSMFFAEGKDHPIVSESAEIAIVVFGDQPKVMLDFAPITAQEPPILTACGGTPMGAGVMLGLDIGESQKKSYSSAGQTYYQPWMVLMTDGQPTDDIEEAVRRAQKLMNDKRLSIFPVAIGPGADINVLKRFSLGIPVLKLKGLYYAEFFKFLSESAEAASQSKPGEKLKMDVDPNYVEIVL